MFAVLSSSADKIKINLVVWCSVTAISSHVSSLPFQRRINAPLRLVNLRASPCAHLRCAVGFELLAKAKRSLKVASCLEHCSCLSDRCDRVVYWRALASFRASRQQNRAPGRGEAKLQRPSLAGRTETHCCNHSDACWLSTLTVTPARQVNIHTQPLNRFFPTLLFIYFFLTEYCDDEKKKKRTPSVHVSLLHSNSLRFDQLHHGSEVLGVQSVAFFLF